MSQYAPVPTEEDFDEFISPDSTRKKIFVVFYRRNHENEGFLFNLVSSILYLYDGHLWPSKPFVHMELCVEDPDIKDVCSYGIQDGDKRVHKVYAKHFNNPVFDPPSVIMLHVTEEDFNRVVKFMERCTKKKLGFDNSLFWNFVPVVNWFRTPSRKWFCSKLTCMALKKTKDNEFVNNSVNPNYLTPHMLYNLVAPHGKLVSLLNVINYSTVGMKKKVKLKNFIEEDL